MTLAQALIRDPSLIDNIQQEKLVTDNLKDLHFDPVRLMQEITAQKKLDRSKPFEGEAVIDYSNDPKLHQDTEPSLSKVHQTNQSSKLTDALDFNPASTIDSMLNKTKKTSASERHSVILLARGSRRISNIMDEYGGMSIQRTKDLYEAQNLEIPFSNDYYKPVWDTADPERHTQLRKQLGRLVSQDVVEESEYSESSLQTEQE